MILSIQEYDTAEAAAADRLGARAVQAFGPVTFDAVGYPVRVRSEQALARYVDAMHETKDAVYFKSPDWRFSRAEADLIRDVCERVVRMTAERFGRAIRPWMAPLAAVHAFRIVAAFASLSGRKQISVVEIGPGSGYLGSLLIAAGHRYAAMDNAQAFYLWQNRLYSTLAGADFAELASERMMPAMVSHCAVHIPWWHFASFRDDPPLAADVVVCDNALGEMTSFALRFTLCIAARMLRGDGAKLFLFTSPGQTRFISLESLAKEVEAAGYALVFFNGFFGFAPKDSALYEFGVSTDLYFDRRPSAKIKRRLTRFGSRLAGTPFAPLGRGVPVFGGGKESELLSAGEVIALRGEESPLDYEFLSYAGYEVPYFSTWRR
ncbi:MAG: hypothetical protein ACT4P2_07895 [Pseudomonadota bacterium]